MKHSRYIDISTARFANVAFSDGSLLYSFDRRLEKRQPIVAPRDIRRYFLTHDEAGILCLVSCIFGQNRDIFFPRLKEEIHMCSFSDIATRYLKLSGFEPHVCESESDAKSRLMRLIEKGKWACLFTDSDTTGEKEFEEFYTHNEFIDTELYVDFGVIKNELIVDERRLETFESSREDLKLKRPWLKQDLIDLFNGLIPNFSHKETGKYLDSKM